MATRTAPTGQVVEADTAEPRDADQRRRRRIEVRVSPAMYEHLEHAAALVDQTLSGFIVEAARRAAVEAVEQHEVIRLNVEQSRIVADLLLNPPDPSPALVEAWRRYEERVAEQQSTARSTGE